MKSRIVPLTPLQHEEAKDEHWASLLEKMLFFGVSNRGYAVVQVETTGQKVKFW